MQRGNRAKMLPVKRSVKAASDYRCKVRIIHEKEITVHAKNKKEAEEEAIERANELLEVLRSDS